MNKKEEEIQRKLLELENSVLKEQTDLTTVSGSSATNMTAAAAHGKSIPVPGSMDDTVARSDGAYFGGVALIILGLVLVFQHVRVGSGLLSMLGLGQGGFALLFLPLMIGLGMMFYNSKNKWGWIVTAGSCALLILTFLATLQIGFPSLSMMQLVIMFVPFALGGALLIKGLGGPKGVEKAIKNQIAKKEG